MRMAMTLLLLALASNAFGEIYTWKDKRGTSHYTNSLYEIPERYRAKAKLLDVATGKQVPIGSLPAGSAAPGTAPSQPATPQPQPATPQPQPATPPVQAAPAPGPAGGAVPVVPGLRPAPPGSSQPGGGIPRRVRRQHIQPQGGEEQ